MLYFFLLLHNIKEKKHMPSKLNKRQPEGQRLKSLELLLLYVTLSTQYVVCIFR